MSRPRPSSVLPLLLTALAALAADGNAGAETLLEASYPIEVRAERHVAVLHWLDSLAGYEGPGGTAGKTVGAHRLDYTRRFGALEDADRAVLARFVAARRRGSAAGPDPWALTTALLEASTTTEALAAAANVAGRETADELGRAFAHFGPRYEEVWREGAVARGFLLRSRGSRLQRTLAKFLVDVARFYGVSPRQEPMPCVHLAPVIEGHGTHAQAVGRHLLIEIRRGEGVGDQVAPIVHENAHLLFHRMTTKEELRLAAASRGARSREAWSLLAEALPTAIAQGVAAERFQPDTWSARQPWYHRVEIDRYAKALFPLVREHLARGGTFDRAFLERALARY